MYYRLLLISSFIYSSSAYSSISKLEDGFKGVIDGLSSILAYAGGAAIVLYALLSFFDADKYQRKIGNVIGLCVLGAVGSSLTIEIIGYFGTK